MYTVFCSSTHQQLIDLEQRQQTNVKNDCSFTLGRRKELLQRQDSRVAGTLGCMLRRLSTEGPEDNIAKC